MHLVSLKIKALIISFMLLTFTVPTTEKFWEPSSMFYIYGVSSYILVTFFFWTRFFSLYFLLSVEKSVFDRLFSPE